MYHRIAELNNDPWGLAVSPAHFAEQLEVLHASRSVMPLNQFASDLGTTDTPRQPIVVTFDDGYGDNVDTAKPLLERYGIPAAIFLATGAIGSSREFWWDELERVLLDTRTLPDVLDLRGADWTYQRELDEPAHRDVTSARFRSWRAWETPPTARHSIYSDLWKRLYALPQDAKRALLDELLEWAELKPLMRSTYRPISVDEARQLSRTTLIECGAHTVTHPVLPDLSVQSQMEEIQRSKTFLETTVGRPVTCFAYPHGKYDSNTMSAVRDAGFTIACTTAERLVSDRSDRLALPRFQVLDWGGDEFQARLRSWRDEAQDG